MTIKERREAKSMTQAELAKQTGLHPVKIAQIECGRIAVENMTLRTAAKLAKALGCHAEELLD